MNASRRKAKKLADKKLKREMGITNLLKPESIVKWESEHKICFGLYDDEGLESMDTIDEINIDSLDTVVRRRKNLMLRARFNTKRNPEFFIIWLHKNSLHLLDKMMEKNDYKKAKEIILKHGHKC